MNTPPPLSRDYDKDPNIKALKRRGLINHRSTLRCSHLASLAVLGEGLRVFGLVGSMGISSLHDLCEGSTMSKSLSIRGYSPGAPTPSVGPKLEAHLDPPKDFLLGVGMVLG